MISGSFMLFWGFLLAWNLVSRGVDSEGHTIGIEMPLGIAVFLMIMCVSGGTFFVTCWLIKHHIITN